MKLLSFIIVTVVMVVLFLLPTIAPFFGVNNPPEPFRLWPSVQGITQPTAIPSNSSGSSSQNAQTQQTSDNAIANDTITVAGVFAAVVGVILALLALTAAVATAFGIFEVNRIRQFRNSFDKQLELFGKQIETEFGQLDERIETELGQLDKRIDTESQKHIEASYYYSEGTKDYRAGDNKHAIENYLQSLKYQPNSPRILERIGRAYSNLNEEEKAIEYLKLALELDSEYEPALRSLALYYRYSNRQEAIKLLKQILANNPSAYESWDFLGLCYRDQLQQGQQLIRDQEIIDEAVGAHENALKVQKRPETEFYLGILLFFSPTGDKSRARDLLLSASKRVEEQEHDVRIRGVWKKLIMIGAPIVDGNLAEALKFIQDMIQYKPTQRISLGVESHLRFLLEGTGHSDWMQAFMDIIITWKES
ncbi:MAG: tetratricopeptide repeat protein [Ktedonobacteraceae bacterium]